MTTISQSSLCVQSGLDPIQTRSRPSSKIPGKAHPEDHLKNIQYLQIATLLSKNQAHRPSRMSP